MLKPRRTVTGMSAILLPFSSDHEIDWESFVGHIERTADAGLVPAVNMDTGYANLIGDATRRRALELTRDAMSGKEFVAGAFVADGPSDSFNLNAYQTGIGEIQRHAGTPVIFQSYGLAQGSDAQIVANYQQIAQDCDRFIAFELGTMFAPFGNIYSLEVYKQLLQIPQCVGAKHSSLRRDLEWQRLQLRDQVRPDFMVLTGNDLAIDMIMYGSDYLLGLSTFCPDVFARRDKMWETGDPQFYQLNDVLQYLGFLAFRQPTSAYKHNAAQFLHQRGWIKSDLTHPNSPQRPASDREILAGIWETLENLQ
jgi:dihydrodipicolinate synthase/N-acetylneuraminate lyase